MNKLTLIILFFLMSAYTKAQDSSLIKIDSWKVVAENFKVDHLGNYYLLNKNEISKYNSDKKFIGRYSNKQLGGDYKMDVLNPLKVLLYSQSLSIIIFLDNMMGKATTEINLNEYNLGTANLACSSYNNGFWIYNPVNFSLSRYDESLKQTVEVNFLNQITQSDLQPNYICEYTNQLYMNNPQTGILVFDIFGTYYKTIPIKNLKSFVINESQLFYEENNKLISYHLKTLKTAEIVKPADCVYWNVNQQNIYFLNGNEIAVYKVK